MHFVTKVLVVFCAILSLVLSALTMAYATNAGRIRAEFNSEREQKLAYKAQAESDIAGAAVKEAELQKQMSTLQGQLEDANKQVNDLQATRTELRAQVEQAKADAIAIRNQISQLGATASAQQGLIGNYREEVTRLREDLVKSSKREIELVDRINDLSSQREVLEQNARALKEQLEEIKLNMQTAGGSVPGSGLTAVRASEPQELVGPLVRARVLDVSSLATGDLIVISEGANRGLRENTLMHIIRGDNQFIGSVVLTRVEPDKSVGRVNLYGRTGVTVQKDDVVLSRLETR
ncbi:MAG: hypothetical protein IT438_00260 [Phycisphaerales bacterium]|nr:hypothetical protein [Phycisphaerales bacterium]